MNKHRLRFALILPLVLAAGGCVNDPSAVATGSVTIGDSAYVRGDISTLTYRAVDLMLAAAPEVGAGTPVVVASISDTEHVDTTSPLGNIMSDMIRTRLTQDGHTTTEMRLRRDVAFNKGQGEFLLSRNPRTLMPPPNTAAVVTGTYAAGVANVYVSLKLVSATDAHIISGADFVVPFGSVIGLLPESKI